MLRFLALPLAFLLAPLAQAGDCQRIESGVDPGLANNYGDVIFGEAIGQTFRADGRLIESITVWRVPYQDVNAFGMHVFVTATDSLGRPDETRILASGPEVFHPNGDGVNPTEFEFVFDPPLALPNLGKYYFAIQSTPCYGTWRLLGVVGIDHYPEGYTWLNGKTDPELCPYLNPLARRSNPNADLCFRIRYCDFATPTKRSSWGELKVIYR
ncbi:MAG TPA: hypothetical protein VFQ05_16800 [Candidatus Eisenbacteria bacterium]|nr:hypothetical protein [Candidatus Eisenbacteria bacterium]